METRAIVAEPEPDGTLTVYIAEPGSAHASTLDRRDRRSFPSISCGWSRRISAAASAPRCISIRRTCSAPISRANLAHRSSGGRAAPKAINRPAMAAPIPRISRSRSGTTARILGMKVETLGNVGAYLSNMASGGPTVNTVNFGTGNYKIDELRGDVPRRRDQHRAGRCLSRLRPARRRLYRRARDRRGRAPPQARPGRGAAEEFHSARRNFPIVPTAARASMYDSGNYQGCSRRRSRPSTMRRAAANAKTLRRSGIYRGIGVAAYTHMCGMAPSRRLAMSGFDRGGWESARVSDRFQRTTPRSIRAR